MNYPRRHESHSLEERSVTFFRLQLPDDWNINSIDRDYGQDLNIEVPEDGNYRGLDLIIQLKSSTTSTTVNNNESQTFRVSTYNYLWNNLRVVMIVKYILSENEAFWILLKDVKPPNQNNKTFTIHIPRVNKLSEIDWNQIRNYIREVTDRKLYSQRSQQ